MDPQPASTSDRFPIAAQPDRYGDACHEKRQPDPQTRSDQELSWSEVHQRIHRAVIRHERPTCSAATEAVTQPGSEVRAVESNLLDDADGGPRQGGPQKYCAPCP